MNTLKIDSKIYKLYGKVFREFVVHARHQQPNRRVQPPPPVVDEEGKVVLEIDIDRFNYLILIVTVVLNYELRNDPESVLQSLIERFFRRLDQRAAGDFEHGEEVEIKRRKNKPPVSSSHLGAPSAVVSDDENDLSSQYSTLSSLIGIQV
jgi:hypothetical protein